MNRNADATALIAQIPSFMTNKVRSTATMATMQRQAL